MPENPLANALAMSVIYTATMWLTINFVAYLFDSMLDWQALWCAGIFWLSFRREYRIEKETCV